MGTDEPDTLVGTPGNDVIKGLGGDDTIYGNGGDDVICGNEGNDLIHGGGGNDLVYGGNGSDKIYGGNGADVIHGTNGDDVLYGGLDDDVIFGGNGMDAMYAGPGDDRLFGGDQDDLLIGDDGADFLNGGAGNDKLIGGNGNDILVGEDGNDKLQGGNDDDSLDGGVGHDSLNGGDGHDTLRGGPGDNVLRGGNGNDTLYGGDDNESLYGDAGFDRLYGGGGDDLLSGGTQPDHLNGGPGKDTLDGGPGYDTYDWYYPQSDTITYLSVEDTVNMNWLARTASSAAADDFAVMVPIYGSTGLNHVRTVLRPQLRANDILFLTSGNWRGTVDPAWVNRAAAALKREFPENKIVLLTSGIDNIVAAAAGVSHDVDTILYGYEPNMPNEPEFDWDFAETLTLTGNAIETVRAAGFEGGIYPTGRPVLQKRTWDWGWGPYDWNYGELHKLGDSLVIQTQTYCEDGAERYDLALDKVNQEMPSGATWYPQVSITTGDTNSVSLARAEVCTDHAKSKGLPGMMVWWSVADVDTMVQYLAYLGR